MAKDIMTSGIEMSDVIKTTGFPVPEDMEGKTFAECVSGSGGNVTLYAWKENSWSMQCYTYTDNPKAGDTVLAGAKGDLSSDIIFDVVESVEENIIKTHINDIISYSRYPDGDIVLQAGEGGSIIAEPLVVTENGVYTAPSGKAYSPVTVNVPTSGGSDAFRYFDGRESGYESTPRGFWVIRKDQTFGNAYCVTAEGLVPEQEIKRVTSNSLSVDPNGRESFPEVTVDVDYFITALVYKGIKG